MEARTGEEDYWCLPVVAETYDGTLNDINGMHVTTEHVLEALDSATSGPVREGSVGGGTGMICHEFKGGIGTASRRLPEDGAAGRSVPWCRRTMDAAGCCASTGSRWARPEHERIPSPYEGARRHNRRGPVP